MAFMEDLRTEKMTPRMESKVEGFMEQMMQINAISVENLGKREHKESLSKENQKLANSINTIIEQEHKSLEKRNIDQARYQNSPALSRSPYRESSPQPTRQQYTTIMSKLANGYTVANGYTLANGYGVPNGHTLKSSHYVE